MENNKETIKRKLVDQNPLDTMAVTLVRLERIEEQCRTLQCMVIILNMVALMLLGLIVWTKCDEVITILLISVISFYLAYKGFKRIELDEAELEYIKNQGQV